MKVPCCSVCQTRYNEEERVPLLLQCGHGFCRECLSKMFSASPDTTLCVTSKALEYARGVPSDEDGEMACGVHSAFLK